MKNNKRAIDPPGQDCPAEAVLSDFLENRLSQEKVNRLLEHLANCRCCLTLLELGHRAKQRAEDMPTTEMLVRAKDLARKNPRKSMLKFKWPALASFSFILSFVFAKYFVQFLVLAVIFSLKWVFDTGSTRTLIMIYQAWRKKDSATAQQIIRDFSRKS
ncbi:MAG: hypothetical protein HQ595_00715 [Candidatus Omnitrophica bacterium]|nr:hypothetical protein [Candidatus Omnitrophota bacterium]